METIPKHIELCPFCDSIIEIPQINEGERFRCHCCNNVIISLHKSPIVKPLIYSLVALFLFICTELIPFIEVNCSGVSVIMNIRETVTSLYEDDFKVMSAFVYIFMQVIPLFCLISIIIVNFSFLLKKQNALQRFLSHNFFIFKNWSMVDVFLIGILVSLIKLYSMVNVTLLGGFICFCLFSFFYINAVNSQKKYFVWNKLLKRKKFEIDLKIINDTGLKNNLIFCQNCNSINSIHNERCLDCNYKIEKRKNKSLQKSIAFLIAAIILYIPSNLLPMMITVYLGKTSYSTIFEGVQFMWETDSRMVAIIIFIASVMIPILKILILLFIIYSIQFNKTMRLVGKTKLYILTEFIGKWSMVDVFVVTIMTTLLQMGSLLSIYPGFGAISFCAVVLLTMLSANSLDIRNLWIDDYNDTATLETKPNI